MIDKQTQVPEQDKDVDGYSGGDPYPTSKRLYEPLLSTIAKGKHPQYFSDRNLDTLFSILMVMVTELAVTRDRLDTVERMAKEKGLFGPSDVDVYEFDSEAGLERSRRHEEYFHRVLRTINQEVEGEIRPKTADYESVLKTVKS